MMFDCYEVDFHMEVTNSALEHSKWLNIQLEINLESYLEGYW